MNPSSILIRNLCVHNLRGVDLEIPLQQLVVVTGVSGSGKSSLAFDTLFVEGQRRYIETFSLATRQYLEKFERPSVDRIENIPPTISLRQLAQTGHKLRNQPLDSMNLGTVTGLTDHLKLLFLRCGHIICPTCQRKITWSSPGDVAKRLALLPPGTRILVTMPTPEYPAPPPLTTSTAKSNTRKSSTRSSPSPANSINVSSSIIEELRQQGFRRGVFSTADSSESLTLREFSKDRSEDLKLKAVVIDRLTAGSQSPERILESCEAAVRNGKGAIGLWSQLPLPECPTHPCQIDGQTWYRHEFYTHLRCEACQQSFPKPQLSLLDEDLDPEPALHPASTPAALLKQALCLGNLSWDKATDQSIEQLAQRIESFRADTQAVENSSSQSTLRNQALWDQVLQRIEWCRRLGLNELPLSRSTKALSGTEYRRARLIPLLSADLVNTLYVLDEPLAGLDNRTALSVLEAIMTLLNSGNSLLMVEHHPLARSRAHFIIEMGPGAGNEGGQVTFSGPNPRQNLPSEEFHETSLCPPMHTLREPAGWLELGPTNLKNLHQFSWKLPLGLLCVVTGDHGTGKSAALIDGLNPNHDASAPSELAGSPLWVVDSSPLKGSPGQMIVGWLDLFGEVRSLFGQTPEAKNRQLTARFFSLHVAQSGRCSQCKGTGQITADLTFFDEAAITCPNCHGKRFRRDALDIRYRGLNIAEVLDLTVSEALTYFKGHHKLQSMLTILSRTGLGYLRLGQTLKSLSGGERQRIKLALALGQPAERGIFVCDEPTMGLHEQDVRQLMQAFRELVSIGHTVWLADIHPLAISSADWLILLKSRPLQTGPEVVFSGPATNFQC